MSSHADGVLRSRFAAIANRRNDSDWGDVLRRAGQPEPSVRRRRTLRPRRALVLALGIAVLVLAVGVTLAATLGGFSRWLTGTPGTPAPAAEQQAFERANAHSFLGFPSGTELRQLIRSQQGDPRVDLLGFRAGGTLCLRVVVSGKTSGRSQSCAPLAELRRSGPPVRVVLVDRGFGKGTKRAWYGIDLVRAPAVQVTAGIVADGVRAVVVEDDWGRHTLAVRGNAFLYVARSPNVGQRVGHIWAEVGRRSVSIPFAPAATLFGGIPNVGRATGPTHVERHVTNGKIGWLERHEPLGQSLDVLPGRDGALVRRHTVFGRVVAPDPGQPVRVAVTLSTGPEGGKALGICTWIVMRSGVAGGCAVRAQLFATSPITSGVSLGGGSDQFSTIAGLASDDVARIVVFLANGQRMTAPLSDNAYLVQVARSTFPVRLVAYDQAGRVVGFTPALGDLGSGAGPARGKAQPLLHVTSATGATAQLLIGNSTAGGKCMYVRWYESKHARGVVSNCSDLARPGSPLQLGTSGSPAQFVMGRVYRSVASIELLYADGRRATVRPTQTFVLYAVPGPHLDKGHELISAVAQDANGRPIGSESFTPPRHQGG
jgi:hypothetical protein